MNRNFVIQIFLLFLFFFSGFSFAQNDLLQKRITLAAQKEPLENVLITITKQTGVRFSYNSQLMNPKREVTVNVQNKTIKEVLPKILPSTVSYKKIGEHIVLLPKKEEKPNSLSSKTIPMVEEKNLLFSEEKVSDGVLTPSDEKGLDTVKIVKKNTFPDNGKITDNCLDSINLTKEENMKAQIAGLILAVAAVNTPVAAQDTVYIVRDTLQTENVQNIENKQQITCKPLHLTFFYPLGTGFVKSSEKCYHLSVNILGGVTGQLKGLGVASLFNISRYAVMGMQTAGLFNLSGVKNTDIHSLNAQFAGIFNHTQKGKSVQFAGVFNSGDTAYLQAGGIFNIAHKSYAQFAGVFNIANTTDAQVAGIFNQGDSAHFQAAGIWNVAKQTKCQLAGIANIAQKSYCQIAGIVNITKKGGFQMGLINVRDTADGISLGLINIVKKGGILEAGIEAGEFVHTALTFRSGVPRLYSILSLGYNYTDNLFTVGSGLGTSFNLIGNLGLNLELTYTTLYNTKNVRFGRKFAELVQLKPVLNYRFAKHFKIYAGPSFNLFIQRYNININPELVNSLKVKAPYSLYHRNIKGRGGYDTLDFWIGVVGGIKF